MPIHASAAARARAGFSLLEAVIAVAIVGITSVSALEAVGGDMRSAARSRRAMEVEALATTRLDVLSLYDYNALQALPDSVKTGKFPAPLDEYSWTTTSAPVSDQPGLYDVHVTIVWPEGSYGLRTYLFRSPPFATGTGRGVAQ